MADITQFPSEVDALRELVTDQRERDILEKIRELAVRRPVTAGLELHLQGD